MATKKRRDVGVLARELIRKLERRGVRIIKVTLHFKNDDVPKYLAKLHGFEKASRRSKFVCK